MLISLVLNQGTDKTDFKILRAVPDIYFIQEKSLDLYSLFEFDDNALKERFFREETMLLEMILTVLISYLQLLLFLPAQDTVTDCPRES